MEIKMPVAVVKTENRSKDRKRAPHDSDLCSKAVISDFHRHDLFDSWSVPKNQSVAFTPKVRRGLVLVLSDSLMVLLSIVVGYVIAAVARAALLIEYHPPEGASGIQVAFIYLVAASITHWFCWTWGHYTRFKPVWTEYRDLVKVAAYAGATSVMILFALKEEFSRLWIGFFALSMLASLPVGRFLSRQLMERLGWWFKSTYVVGTGDNALRTAIALESDMAMGRRVDGFISFDECGSSQTFLSGKPVLSRISVESELKANKELPCIVFAFDSLREMDKYRAIMNRYVAISPHVTISPPISGLPLYSAEVLTVFKQDTVLLKLQNNINNWRARVVKRTFDIVISSALLFLLTPVMSVVAWLISRDGNSSIYGHERIGRSGKHFKCLKFRSMIADGDAILTHYLSENAEAAMEWQTTRKLRNDPRITNIGRFLRNTSLDELPQLLNVLKGEMSLVGPRPIVQQEIHHYGDHYPYYLSMTPGITGLWQTSGRSDTTYHERVLLDVWYARNWSLWHDVVLLLRTVPSLLARDGAR